MRGMVPLSSIIISKETKDLEVTGKSAKNLGYAKPRARRNSALGLVS